MDSPDRPLSDRVNARESGVGAPEQQRAAIEKEVRYACATIAAAEYEYWKGLPDPADPMLQAMHMSAMGAAANICAAIFLGWADGAHGKAGRAQSGPLEPKETQAYACNNAMCQLIGSHTAECVKGREKTE